jgi:hypothetical protein
LRRRCRKRVGNGTSLDIVAPARIGSMPPPIANLDPLRPQAAIDRIDPGLAASCGHHLHDVENGPPGAMCAIANAISPEGAVAIAA